jgi:excisionase family DNA binding protein
MASTLVDELAARKTMMTIQDVVELLGVHQQTVYEWVWVGKIPSIRVGSRIKFDPRALGAWLREGQLG